MTELSEEDLVILDRYSKAIVHLREAYRRESFSISLGINFTAPIGIPDWDALFNRVADHPQINGNDADCPQDPPAQRAKLLYKHFAEGNSTGSKKKDDETLAAMQTEGEWFDILRDCLYRDISQTENLDNHHPYLQSWLSIFQEISIVLNYGIDNGFQMTLGDHARLNCDGERFWETVHDADLPFSNNVCSIYHPYGYLPENVLDGFSDTVAFPDETSCISSQEDSAQKALLQYLFSKQTFILLGVSLEDNPLIRYHLRQNAKQNPGHIHYHVQQRSQSDVSAQHEQPDERFEKYNLVTLNLNVEECQSLSRLIRCDRTTFKKAADRHDIRIKWVYYITGTPGVGKTSTVNHFRGLTTYPEFSEEPPEILKLPFKNLDHEQEAKVDRWIAKQYAQRNSRLAAEDEGILVADRAPLDPILFTDDNKTGAKATWYRNRLNKYGSHEEVVPGSVLLLTCDPEVIAARLARRQAAGDDPPYLANLEERGKNIYNLPGVQKISTEESSVEDVVSAISKHIHHHHYNPAALDNRLSELEKHDG